MKINDIRKERKKIVKQLASDIYGTGIQGLINRLKKPARIITICLGFLFVTYSVVAYFPLDFGWFFVGLSLWVFAVASGYIGFLSSFICAFTVFSAYPFAEIIKNAIIGTLTQTNIDFLKSYIPTFVFLPIILILSLVVRSIQIKKPSFSAFNNQNGRINILDPALEQLYPIQGFENLIQVNFITHSKRRYSSIISDFIKFARVCDKQKALPAGAEFIEKDKEDSIEVTFYAYSSSESRIPPIKSYVTENLKDSKIYIISDINWNIYKDVIMPDDIIIQREYNKHFSENLEKRGVDLSQTKKLSYIIVFNSKNEAESCLKTAPENGFIPIKTDGEIIKHDKNAIKDMYIITLQLESKLGIERLNINSMNVIDFVKKFNGSLRHWMFSKA
ncbi:MAG: hypothetical protein DBX47_00120 [Clostridiales bacterium]|nr:MAG: hypothetical protein DBX47_00120 [Clostridiales bacterium]